MGKKIEEALEKVDNDEIKLDEATEKSEVESEVAKEETSISDKVQESAFDAAKDIEAIFSGMDLSKEFKDKALSIYETSVKSEATRIAEAVAVELDAAKTAEIDELIEQYDADFEAAKENINEQIDDYLSVITKDWLTENALEASNIVRSELSESFMSQLADLLREHYVDIPDEQLDVVAELQEEIEAKSADVSKLMEEVVEYKNQIEALNRAAVLKEAAEGLTDLESEKLTRLAEAVDFTDEEAFATKLTEIKEAYFKKDVVEESKNNSLDDNEPIIVLEEEEKVLSKTSPSLNAALRHLGKASRVVPAKRS